MTQYLRPNKDGMLNGMWENDKGLTGAMYASVDNVVINDGEYIASFDGIKGNVFRCNLSSTVLPKVGPHIIRYRVKRTSGSGIVYVFVSLYDKDRLICKSKSYPLNSGWDQYTYTLPLNEIAYIENYHNLSIEFEIESSEDSSNAGISWLEMEIPNGHLSHLSSKGRNMTETDYEQYKRQIEKSMPPIGVEAGPKLIIDAWNGHVYQAQDEHGEWWTLKGECNRCGECCDHTMVDDYKDRWKCNFMRAPSGEINDNSSALYEEMVDEKKVYGCKLHFSKPWGCKIYPSEPSEKLFPSCSYSWEKVEKSG